MVAAFPVQPAWPRPAALPAVAVCSLHLGRWQHVPATQRRVSVPRQLRGIEELKLGEPLGFRGGNQSLRSFPCMCEYFYHGGGQGGAQRTTCWLCQVSFLSDLWEEPRREALGKFSLGKQKITANFLHLLENNIICLLDINGKYLAILGHSCYVVSGLKYFSSTAGEWVEFCFMASSEKFLIGELSLLLSSLLLW